MNKLFVTALAVSLMSSATQKGISSDHFLTADNSGRHGTLLVRDSGKPAGNDLTAVRYIDYENGDDRNDGTREFPWQHHPWDENAQGNAAKSGNFRKYIFKKGVIYRGFIDVAESGGTGTPVILTSDDAWGEGEAIIAGSEELTRKWIRCNPEITSLLPAPSKKKAWCYSLRNGEVPRLMWEHTRSGYMRIPIARTPNWGTDSQDDPRNQWYELEDVIIELSITVQNVEGFSVGDSIVVSGKRPRPQSTIGKDTRITIQGINPGEFHVEVENWHVGLLKKGDVITNGMSSTVVESPGGTHKIYRRLIDSKNLKIQSDREFTGATIWAERRSMPKPDPGIVERSNASEQSVSVNFHRNLGGGARPYDRYFLEGLPNFLDSANEYVFLRQGERGGVIVMRLAGDRDPNFSIVEAAMRPVIIKIPNKNHIEVSHLSFMFSNQLDLGTLEARHAPLYASAIQINGTANDIHIHHCIFSNLAAGIVGHPEKRPGPSILDNIEISNNSFSKIDGSAIALGDGQTHYALKKSGSRLIHVDVSENKLKKIGFRTPARFGLGSQGHGISIEGSEVLELSDNKVYRSWGSGISVTMGSGYKFSRVERPFLRSLIHHNEVVDSLLGFQDAGGITSWMGGPTYIYNNLSGNPVGCMHSREKTSNRKDWYRRGCYGVGFYLDGQYKGYVFNNIAWGKNNNVNDHIYNSVALNEAMGFMNIIFNNTFYNFGIGLHKGMYQHNRSYYLGNLFLSIYGQQILQEAITGTVDYGTLAYARNIFYGKTKKFGSLGTGRAEVIPNLEYWRDRYRKKGLMESSTGTYVWENPVNVGARNDFSPRIGSEAIDRGAKVFVPWALYGVIGEWHFLRRQDRPDIISGEHIYMNSEWVSRGMFHQIPRHNLECRGTSIEDYKSGTLEDWLPGALHFDGRRSYCVASHERAIESYSWRDPSMKTSGRISTAERRGLDIADENLVIETVLKLDSDMGSGAVLSKRDGKGYTMDITDKGHVRLVLNYGQEESRITSRKSINDGRWHHVLIEVDRLGSGETRIYVDSISVPLHVDGEEVRRGSLSNSADLWVGRGDAGFFKGSIDFLRIATGTLAQAETDIEELYKWEFEGPFLKDFYGNSTVDHRDIGAVEYQH